MIPPTNSLSSAFCHDAAFGALQYQETLLLGSLVSGAISSLRDSSRLFIIYLCKNIYTYAFIYPCICMSGYVEKISPHPLSDKKLGISFLPSQLPHLINGLWRLLSDRC